MADFTNLTLTSAGTKALLEMQTGKTLTFSKIGLGSGRNTGSYWGMTDLVNPMVKLPIAEKTVKGTSNHIVFVAKMTNETLDVGFEWRELGLYYQDDSGNDVLFAASNAGEKYDYIPAITDERYLKQIRLASTIADTDGITIIEQEGLFYVDTATFQEAIDSLEGRIGGGKELENHIADKDNPHSVTAEQVGAADAENHNTKTYTSLEQIGITTGEETIESIVEALPDGSVLIFPMSSSNNKNIYPSGVIGTCVVKYSGRSRNDFTFTSTTGRKWFGTYYGSTSTWSGWKEVVTSESLQSLLTGGEISMVKSIQRGLISMGTGDKTKTATINAVNTEKAVVFWSGEGTTSTDMISTGKAHLTLTNSTTVTAEKYGTSASVYVPYQVVEFY